MSHFDEEKQLRCEDVTQASTHEDGQIITSPRPTFANQLNRFLSQLGAEERGIERVLPDERSHQAPFQSTSRLLTSSIRMIISRYG